MEVVGGAVISNTFKQSAYCWMSNDQHCFFCMNDDEVPPLECEDAPGWLCLVQSRDDEATTEFCCAVHLHDLDRSF